MFQSLDGKTYNLEDECCRADLVHVLHSLGIDGLSLKEICEILLKEISHEETGECTMEREQFPTDPTTLRAEARDIEIGAPAPVSEYAGWLRSCADRIEELEELLGEKFTTT